MSLAADALTSNVRNSELLPFINWEECYNESSAMQNVQQQTQSVASRNCTDKPISLGLPIWEW